MLVPAWGDKGWGRGLCQFCSRRLSALARRCVSANDRIVNCAPAKGCVWPDIDRHGRGCAHIGRRGAAVLLRRFASVSWVSYVSYWSVLRLITPAIRFYWNVLRLVHACYTFLLECLASDSRLLYISIGMSCVWFTPVSFPSSGKERRLARGCVSIPPWVGIALVHSRMLCGYRVLWVHFGIGRFFVAIPTGDGERSRLYKKKRRVGWAFLLI